MHCPNTVNEKFSSIRKINTLQISIPFKGEVTTNETSTFWVGLVMMHLKEIDPSNVHNRCGGHRTFYKSNVWWVFDKVDVGTLPLTFHLYNVQC